MANAIELITKYGTEAWDSVYRTTSKFSLFIPNSKQLIVDSADWKTVKVAKVNFGGLGWYGRANEGFKSGNYHDINVNGQGYGYPVTDTSLTWETFTLSQDRAAQLRIEQASNDETAKLSLAAAIKDFAVQEIIPETDAYGFSKLASYTSIAFGNQITTTPTTDNVLQQLDDAFEWHAEHEVPEDNQVIFVNPHTFNILVHSKELTRFIEPTSLGLRADLKFEVGSYQGRPVISVPSNRFFTNIVLTNNGYSQGPDSRLINFMVVSKDAVYDIVRYQIKKVFSPDVVQDFDGYKIDNRVYYDVFVPDNKRVAVYANVATAAQTIPSLNSAKGVSVASATANSSDISAIALTPASIYASAIFLDTTGSAPAVGDTVNTTTYPGASGVYDVSLARKGETVTVTALATTGRPTSGQLIAIDSMGQVVAKGALDLAWSAAS